MGYIHVEILSANNLKRLFLTHKKLFLGTKIMELYLGIKNIGHLYKEQVRQKKKKTTYIDVFRPGTNYRPGVWRKIKKQQNQLINDLKGITWNGATASVAQ